jgi:hypothetical protein
MKFVDLDNIPKYFILANMPYYKVVHAHGNLSRARGEVINNLTDELENFYIYMDVEDNVHLKVNNIETKLQ